MLEVFQAAISPLNIVFTVMLILVVLYWICVILGAFDIELFDVDLDIGTDIDADVDIDADTEVHGPGFLRAFLAFFYVGEVPVMVLLSVMVCSMWFISMFGNYYLNPAQSWLIAMPIFIGNLFASLMIIKAIGKPLKKFFDMFEKDYNAPRPVLGRLCTVTTTKVSDELGQAQVKTKGAEITLNVITENGETLHKGEQAVVVRKDENKGVYVIAPANLEN